MFGNKRKITQEEYDRAIGNAYRLGYQMGMVEARNRSHTSRGDGLTHVEKEALIILDKKGF